VTDAEILSGGGGRTRRGKQYRSRDADFRVKKKSHRMAGLRSLIAVCC